MKLEVTGGDLRMTMEAASGVPGLPDEVSAWAKQKKEKSWSKKRRRW